MFEDRLPYICKGSTIHNRLWNLVLQITPSNLYIHVDILKVCLHIGIRTPSEFNLSVPIGRTYLFFVIYSPADFIIIFYCTYVHIVLYISVLVWEDNIWFRNQEIEQMQLIVVLLFRYWSVETIIYGSIIYLWHCWWLWFAKFILTSALGTLKADLLYKIN